MWQRLYHRRYRNPPPFHLPQVKLAAVKTILVIEDDPNLRKSITKVLESESFRVLAATDGARGIELAQSHLPDLILCDILMPEQDGYGVLNSLRHSQETSDIPFIFLTSKSDLADLRRGMILGADDYVPKPFKAQDLVDAVQTRLNKKARQIQPYLDQLRQTAESLSRSAYIDLLTGLPNRIGLHRQLQQCLTQRSRHPSDDFMAVICLGITDLADVYQVHGYAAADLLLQEIAARLRRFAGARASNPARSQGSDPAKIQAREGFVQPFLARLSGAQFALLFNSLDHSDELDELIEALTQQLSEPYISNGREIEISLHWGVALHPHHSNRAEQLVAYGETALRWGRENGVTGYQLYTPEIEAADRDLKQLTEELHRAATNDEFYLLYQPQVNLITNRIIAVESFLRWKHPRRGVLLPHKFLPLAQDRFLVETLTDWTIRTACTQAMKFQGLSIVPMSVSVNLSFLQFNRPNLITTVEEILAETGLDPALLTLELTESSLMGDQSKVCRILAGLQELGVKIAIDDFGMGYSSLKDLSKFPLDTLKIDSFFIQNLPEEHYAAVVSSIIAISQTLRLKVIAEGVETEQQVGILRKYGCHAMQGHYHSMPLLPGEIATLLQQGGRLPGKLASQPPLPQAS